MYNYSDTSHKIIKQKKDLFNETYLRLLNEWACDLYTPKSLLLYIQQKISHYLPTTQFYLMFDFKNIFNIIQKDYRYYKQFYSICQRYKNNFFNIFKIYIIFLDLENYNSYAVIQQINDKNLNTKKFYQIIKNDGFPKAETFKMSGNNQEQFSKGCCILIDYKKVNILKQADIESVLDHQFNHYFRLLDNQQKILHPIQKHLDIFQKVALDAGYDINSKDFILHLFSDSQFISMNSDVCNIISFQLIKLYPSLSNLQLYYKWIQLSSKKFLLSNEYQQLNINIQNSLLFSYACRLLDKNRWNILKQHVYKQLNSPKKNIFKSTINWIKQLFKRI